jgi:hypothetical protein
MAIRNDFAPGEVLAAADLNDTFGSKVDYPSGGADGDALIKSGTAAAWGAAGGMVLIASETPTAVSSISINGCFSATYKHYRILFVGTGSSGFGLRFRFRVSGSDNSDSDYSQQFLDVGGTTVSALRGSNDDKWQIGVIRSTTVTSICDVVVTNPFASTNKAFMANYIEPLNGISLAVSGGVKNVTTSFTGFTLFSGSAQTFTGTIQVYGMKE